MDKKVELDTKVEFEFVQKVKGNKAKILERERRKKRLK
jgi:hypothetical protein